LASGARGANKENVVDAWAELRKRWIEGGMKWGGRFHDMSWQYLQPENWNPIKQLKDAGLWKEDK